MNQKEREAAERLASKGGKARAKQLTPERRREIAIAGAEARWGRGLPVAAYPGTLEIGDFKVDCAVLSDEETRLITQSDFMDAMGMYYSGWIAKNRPAEDPGSAEIPHFLSFKTLKPFVQRHLGDLQTITVKYRTRGGNIAHGIRAEIIPKICDVWIDADDEANLGSRQKQVAAKARLLMRALAHVGIVALVDEATGFQEHRARNALAQYLKRYITEEIRQWVNTFPTSFFREICRIRGVDFPEDMRLPRYFGRIVNNLVYDRLGPALREELERRNPTGEDGRRKDKHHQWLTSEIGHPKLLHHLGIVEGIAAGYDEGQWKAFVAHVDRKLPSYHNLPLFAAMEQHEAS